MASLSDEAGMERGRMNTSRSRIVTFHSSLFARCITTGILPSCESRSACCKAFSTFNFSTRFTSKCIPGKPTTSASPFAPQYCCPRRASKPYFRSSFASSSSPLFPLLLLFINHIVQGFCFKRRLNRFPQAPVH